MKVLHIRYIGPGIGFLDATLDVAIVKAIVLAQKRKRAIEFVFNGVIVNVCPDSDPKTVYRKWRSDLNQMREAMKCLLEKDDGTFEVGIGHINNVIDEAVALAKKKNRTIRFKFNGVDVKVPPNSSPRSICRKWEQDFKRRE